MLLIKYMLWRNSYTFFPCTVSSMAQRLNEIACLDTYIHDSCLLYSKTAPCSVSGLNTDAHR